MNRATLLVPLLGTLSAFGAVGSVLALMGAGVPFLAAAIGMSACVGLVLWAATRAVPATDPCPDQSATLRHDLRGALSPALMVSDRLLAHDDPAVNKAGAAVVRSIDRATALLDAPGKPVSPPGPR